MCGSSKVRHGSRADTCPLWLMCVLPLAAATLHLYSVTATENRSPAQQICEASISDSCCSTTQPFSTEQIERDRKLDTDATLKSPINFQNKTLCVETRSYFTKLHQQNVIMCGGLKSAEQRFSEAMTGCDSVITAKSYQSCDSSCPAVLRSQTQLVGVDGWRSMEQTRSRFGSRCCCN